MTSFEDWPRFTSSLGCKAVAFPTHPAAGPRETRSPRLCWCSSTSPNRSGKYRPETASRARPWRSPLRPPGSGCSFGTTTGQAPHLPAQPRPSREPGADMKAAGSEIPLIGKFRTARCVDAPHIAPSGTSISPIESFRVGILIRPASPRCGAPMLAYFTFRPS